MFNNEIHTFSNANNLKTTKVKICKNSLLHLNKIF